MNLTHTVVWTDYRFYSSKLCLFFPEALTRKYKTIAYMVHLLQNVKGTCFNYYSIHVVDGKAIET